MGGARPAGGSDFVYRCCLVLCTVAIAVFGITMLYVQGSGAQASTAAKQAALPRQSAHIKTVRPHRIVRHAARTARAGPDERALTGISERISNNTLAIISGGLGSTDLTVVQELAAALDDGDDLRILPMVGAGGRNIRDVRLMKGVDLGVTQASLLARMRADGELGRTDDRVTYIAKLFNEEMHVLVRADSGLGSIDQLAGHAVSMGEPGSGTQLIARDVLARLGIAVREVNMAEPNAIERVKAGDVDAVILIGGKPAPALANVSGLRVLPVPFAKPLRDDFLPASLSSDDYPGLIASGSSVETLAVGTVLIANNWPKDSEQYRKIEKFVAAFFPQIAQLQTPPHHPKWREVNLAATIPGWRRFPAAEGWLAQHRDGVGERAQFERVARVRRAQTDATESGGQRVRQAPQWLGARAHR